MGRSRVTGRRHLLSFAVTCNRTAAPIPISSGGIHAGQDRHQGRPELHVDSGLRVGRLRRRCSSLLVPPPVTTRRLRDPRQALGQHSPEACRFFRWPVASPARWREVSVRGKSAQKRETLVKGSRPRYACIARARWCTVRSTLFLLGGGMDRIHRVPDCR